MGKILQSDSISTTTSINFQKFLNQKSIISILENTISINNASIYIINQEGQVVFGVYKQDLTQMYPVENGENTLGWVIGDNNSSQISDLLSYLIKQEIEKKSLAQELLDKYEEIDLIDEISTEITISLDLIKLAKLVLDKVASVIQCNYGAIILIKPNSSELKVLTKFGKADFLSTYLNFTEGIIHNIIDKGEGEIVNDVCQDKRCSENDKHIGSLICVPFKTKQGVIAAIIIGSQASIYYTTKELRLLNIFTTQAAIAIEKGLLYEQSLLDAQNAQKQAQQLQKTLRKLQQTQAQLVHSEKMSSLGQMVAGIGHEIRNPINFIKGNLGYGCNYAQDLIDLISLYTKYYPQTVPEIEQKIEDINLEFIIQDFPQLLSSMKFGANRIKDIVRSLGIFSHLDKTKMKAFNIHEGIDGTLMILRHRLQSNENRLEIEIIKKYSELPLIECYAGQLNQVFMNIISNAIDALDEYGKPEGNIIEIRTQILKETSRGIEPQDRSIIVCIADNGPGIPEDIQQKLYEPFFTTKKVGKGTGLGMAISYEIVVEKHHGNLECISQIGKGTEFQIEIPIPCLQENLS
ncbi:MAG: ATP-binding protein [Mastigocoleus sp.]